MDTTDARWIVSSTLAAKGFKHCGPGPDDYRGFLMVGHSRAEVEIFIPDLNFTSIPTIRFLDRRALPLDLIAHLEEGNGLCYADRNLLRLDRYDPGGAILRVLEEAEKTISKSLKGKAPAEIALEYPLYWKGERFQVLISNPARTNTARFALPNEGTDFAVRLLVGRDQKIPSGFQAGRDVLVITSDSNLVPCNHFVAPGTLAELDAWYQQQQFPATIGFSRVTTALANQDAVFFAGPNGWVGCQIQLPADLLALLKKQNARPAFIRTEVKRRKATIGLVRYWGSEASLDQVTKRNLPSEQKSLKGKRIAVLGCGTIGSHLARFLVQCGAGNGEPLIVVDHQSLSAGNIGRHLLNFRDVGKPKAEALAVELRRFHPDVKVTSINADISKIWKRVSKCDLIVDATGVESVTEFLNAAAMEARASGPCNLLHTWLFANGIAAQSFLNIGGEFACYRCLRPELDKPWRYDPRKRVKDTGTVVTASCGDGAYVPFAVNAPVMAASLALGAALDFASGTPGPRLRTLVIDEKAAHSVKDQSPNRHDRCPACSSQ